MRKYDRNAVFNIFLKCMLFMLVFACSFCLMRFAFGIIFIISLLLSAVLAVAAVFMFSFLLRYTKFFYAYYSFVSRFLFKEDKGNVYCPCCGKHFGHFEDERFYDDTRHYDPGTFKRFRQDVICDFCRSAPRQRIIANWAEKNVELLKSSKILYFAPELSMMLWFRRHGIKVSTADLFERRTDLKLDLTDIDLPDRSEDIVFCNHVLEHVPDYKKALSELHRIIREGGKLIISFPIDDEAETVREDLNASADESVRLFGQHDHLRLFGKDSITMLENAGFEVDTIDLETIPEDVVPVKGPSDYDSNLIFCCVRK